MMVLALVWPQAMSAEPFLLGGENNPLALRYAFDADTTTYGSRRPYPLNCRGGARLVMDTIGHWRPGDRLKLSLTFIASPSAAGAEGEGLEPSTCARIDRPVGRDEPRQVRFSPSIGDSTPQRTVRDSTVYWSFLAYNSDSGHFTGVAHRYWDAASPPRPIPYLPHASPPPDTGRVAFKPRYLLWLVLGWLVIVGVPLLILTGRWSGWRRLAGVYPHRSIGSDQSFRTGPIVMGMVNYRGGARLTSDDSCLHFSMPGLLRAGHPPFSVPWPDITASRDAWPWFPFKGAPRIRLTLGRYRGLRILVPVSDGERIVAASGGRLRLREPATPAAGVH
jgi:hypothetical protein